MYATRYLMFLLPAGGAFCSTPGPPAEGNHGLMPNSSMREMTTILDTRSTYALTQISNVMSLIPSDTPSAWLGASTTAEPMTNFTPIATYSASDRLVTQQRRQVSSTTSSSTSQSTGSSGSGDCSNDGNGGGINNGNSVCTITINPPGSSPAPSSKGLSTAEKIGIGVGIGGLVLSVLGIILAYKYRTARQPWRRRSRYGNPSKTEYHLSWIPPPAYTA